MAESYTVVNYQLWPRGLELGQKQSSLLQTIRASRGSPFQRRVHRTPSVSLNMTPSSGDHVCHLWTTNTGRKDVLLGDLAEQEACIPMRLM